MKQTMQTQSTKYNLKRFLLTGALIASMPIVMGNGGCTTTESFMNEMSTASFGMNSQIKRREASIELRRGNIEKSNKAYAQSVGYGTLYRMGETGSERNYNSAEAEKDRRALIEAANIRAQAERDAARIRAEAEENAARIRSEAEGKLYIVPNQKNYLAFASEGVIYDKNNLVGDFKGKGKTEFHRNDEITLALLTSNNKGAVLVYKLFENDKIEPVIKGRIVLDRDPIVCFFSFKNPTLSKYRCDWYIDGDINPIRRVEFEVKE